MSDAQIERAILDLLARRRPGATICPSEASRAVFGKAGLKPDAMQKTRAVAARLVSRNLIEVTQGGHVVDIAQARGPIRLRLKSDSE